MFERITRNTGFAIPGVASGCTAAIVTRGTRLLLVTASSVNGPASLPAASSITPLAGFVYVTVTDVSLCASGLASVSTTVLPATLTTAIAARSVASLPPRGVAFTVNAVAAGVEDAFNASL